MIKKFKIIEILEFIICIVAIAFVFLYIAKPSFTFDTINMGHDWVFHTYRIKEVEEAIKNGVFPIYMGSVGNTVSINPMFYPYLFLYIPALIDLHVNDLSFAINVFNILVFISYFAVAYYSIWTISKNNFLSAIFSITYTASFYLIFNIYARVAVGEYVALIFMPMFVAGVYNLFFDDGKRWYLLLLSFTFIFQSHILTTFYVGLTFIFVCVAFIKKTFSKNIFTKLLKISALFLLLNLWFIVPFLKTFLYNNTNVGTMYEFAGLEKFKDLLGNQSGIPNHFGIEQIVYVVASGLIISFLTARKFQNKYFKIGIYAFIMALMLFVLTFENVITRFILNDKIFNSIYGRQQFSFRVIGRSLVYISLSFSFLVAALLSYIEEKVNAFNVKYIGTITRLILEALILISLVLLVFKVDKNVVYEKQELVVVGTPQIDDFYIYAYIEYNLSDDSKNKNLYQDVRTFDLKDGSDIRLSSNDIQLLNIEKNYISYDISYDIKQYDNNKKYFMELPYEYYIGLVARDENGEKLPSYFKNRKEEYNSAVDHYTTMMILLPNATGNVQVEYEIDKNFTCAKWISIIALILIILIKLSKFVYKKIGIKIIKKQINLPKTLTALNQALCTSIFYGIIIILLMLFIYNASIKEYAGWVEDEKGYRFLDLYGDPHTNEWIDGAYYVGDDGYMLTNSFVESDKKKYFVGDDGAFLVNQEFEYEGKTYIAKENGEVVEKK